MLKLDKGPNHANKTSTIKSGLRKLKLVPEIRRILTWILGWISCFNLCVQQIVSHYKIIMGDLKCEPSLKLENCKEQLLVILALTLFHNSTTDGFKLLMKWMAKVMLLLRRI